MKTQARTKTKTSSELFPSPLKLLKANFKHETNPPTSNNNSNKKKKGGKHRSGVRATFQVNSRTFGRPKCGKASKSIRLWLSPSPSHIRIHIRIGIRIRIRIRTHRQLNSLWGAWLVTLNVFKFNLQSWKLMIAPQPSSLFSWQDPTPLPLPPLCTSHGLKGNQIAENCELWTESISPVTAAARCRLSECKFKHVKRLEARRKKMMEKTFGKRQGKMTTAQRSADALTVYYMCKQRRCGNILNKCNNYLNNRSEVSHLHINITGRRRRMRYHKLYIRIQHQHQIRYIHVLMPVCLSVSPFVCPFVRSSIWKFRS